MRNLAGPGKPGPKPPRRYDCGRCGGRGTVPINPRDPRQGEQTCIQCGGRGELAT